MPKGESRMHDDEQGKPNGAESSVNLSTTMECNFCGATTHTQHFCMDKLQIERGGRCPRCDQTSHSWRNCPTLANINCRSNNLSDRRLHNEEASTSSSRNERESLTRRPDAGLTVRADLNTMEMLAAVTSRTRKIEFGATSRPADAKRNNGISTPQVWHLPQLVERARQVRDAANAVFRQPQLETGGSASTAFPRITATPPTASRQSSAPIKDSAPQVARTNSALSSSSLQPPQQQSLTDNRYLTEDNYLKVLELYDNNLWPTFRPFICCGCHQQTAFLTASF